MPLLVIVSGLDNFVFAFIWISNTWVDSVATLLAIICNNNLFLGLL
jgi:hypothetical protein